MWASIAALVQNGQCNRHATTLNAIGVLYGHCQEQTSANLDHAFDQVIVQIAPDLDQETIEALAKSATDFAGQFPQFAAILQEHVVREQVTDVEPLTMQSQESQTEENNAEQAAATTEDLSLISQDLSAISATTAAPVERRARERNPVEDENNPITLARRASLEELVQIAGLPNLPEALTNVLISRGDRVVIERALKNQSAVFAKSSLTTLAELAPSDRMIKDALVSRVDLPESIAERILPYLNLDAKAKVLLSGAPFSEENCQEALTIATQELHSNTEQGQIMIGLDHCFAGLSEGQSTVSDVISILARDARIAELSAFAAQHLGLCQAATFNALSSRFDHAAAIILRALECNLDAFDDAMQMRRRCGCREAKETKSAWMRSQRYTVLEAQELAQAFHNSISNSIMKKTEMQFQIDEPIDVLAA
jgi:hypothetical protein